MSLRRRAVASRIVAAAASAAASHAGAAGTPDGAALFAQHCAACHQADASGTVGLAPSLKGAHWQRLGADRGYLLGVVLHGLSGPIVVNGQPFVGSMPAFAAQLDDAQIALVANHLRTLQGADAPAYVSDDVKRARALPGSPPASRQRRAQLLGG